MIREQIRSTLSGWLMVAVLLLGFAGALWGLTSELLSGENSAVLVLAWALAIILLSVLLGGFFVVNPNEAKVLTLFGKYSGSVKRDGFHWANPLLTKRHITLRIHNFESSQIKVNDLEGNPVEIASIVVWKVTETAEACFEVDNYEHYVKVQSEAALRNLATQYPYDAYEEHHKSLRGNTSEIAGQLKIEVLNLTNRVNTQSVSSTFTSAGRPTNVSDSRQMQFGVTLSR